MIGTSIQIPWAPPALASVLEPVPVLVVPVPVLVVPVLEPVLVPV